MASAPLLGGQSPLLHLPAELRIRIFEFAVWHEENGGVMSPVPKSKQFCSDERSVIFKAGRRITIKDGRPAPPDLHLTSQQRLALMKGHDYLMGIWASLPMLEREHLCDAKCLQQPSLTRTSVQIRAEALPVFYAVNRFHLELSNFLWCSLSESPVAWWRSLGDNIRLIERLTVIGDSDPTLMSSFAYNRTTGAEVIPTVPDYRYNHLHWLSELKREKVTDRLRRLLEYTSTNGLHMQAVENIVVLLASWAKHLFPDKNCYKGF